MRDQAINGLDAASDGVSVADGPAPLELDVARYAPHLAEVDMTEAQKRELLGTLWSIMQTFVDLGFDVGKADVCGQLFGDFNEAADGGPNGLESTLPSLEETVRRKEKP